MSTETDRPASLAGAPCSTILCRSCGYAGEINTYRPSLSPYADCKCPQCGSTNNQHNDDYNARLRKAWSCKHRGELVDAGKTENGQPLLECKECGSIGLDWSMRGEPMPSSNTDSAA